MSEQVIRAAEILGRCRLFKGFSPEELTRWAETFSCDFAEYQKDETVFEELDQVEINQTRYEIISIRSYPSYRLIQVKKI